MQDYAEFARLERAGWGDGDVAAAYLDGFVSCTRQAAPSLAAAAEAGPGRSILDLCCGPGVVCQALLAEGARVTGLDFSAAMLERARAVAPGARLVEGDAQDLSFEDGEFQGATCGFGLMHVPDQDRALAEILRVLAPGAPFAFTVWEPADRSAAFSIVGQGLAAGDSAIALPDAPDFHRFADPKTAQEILGGAGFEDVSVSTLDLAMPVDRPGDFFAVMRDGAVRIGKLIAQQPEGRREEVERAFEAGVRAWALSAGRDPSGALAVPMPAALVRARKPG